MKHMTAVCTFLLVLGSGPAWAVKYRIDPRPSEPDPEVRITNPWQVIEASAHEAVLTLLNFVVDEDLDQREGVDYPDYDRRGQFGAWIRGEDCHNTRAKILMRDSSTPVVFSESNHCRVTEGLWHDPYTGHDFRQARELQIDHIVPLKNAYNSGAWKWEKSRRCHYANFLNYNSHLITVSGQENMRKGDRTPARYMPPESGFACDYLQRWLNVKAVWDLALDADEVAQIQNLMRSHQCTLRFQTVTQVSLQELRADAAQLDPHCQN